MSVPYAKRLKDLDAERMRLRKLLAEQVVENGVIKYALRKNGDRTGVPAYRRTGCWCWAWRGVRGREQPPMGWFYRLTGFSVARAVGGAVNRGGEAD